ncbi:hypothetical protein ACA910_000511 [Epithemia clementina (nom. ined.)]
MSPPPFKKRSHGESFAIVEAEDSSQLETSSSPFSSVIHQRTTTRTFGITSSLPPFVLEQQIESLKVELDHERNLRSLDQKRAQHAKERLEKQVQIAFDEAKEASKALEDFREQSDKMKEQLRQSLNQALSELRNREIQRLDYYANPNDDSGAEDGDNDNHRRQASSMSNVWKEKCQHLEKLLEAQRAKEKELHNRFASLRADVEARAKKQQEENKQVPHSDSNQSMTISALEDAPPAVMKELNRVRICLSETERRERQLNRKVDELQRRNQSLIRDREEALLAQQRLPVVQEQVEQLRRDYETLAAQHEAWNDLGACLQAIIPVASKNNDSSASSGGQTEGLAASGGLATRSKKLKGPPELSVIQRFLEDAKSRVVALEQQNATLQQQNKELRSASLPLEIKMKELSEAEQAAKQEKLAVERNLTLCQRQVSQLEVQQTIHRREIENLQTLIKTFDELPVPSSSISPTNPGGLVSKMDHSRQTLEISLASTKDELQAVQSEKDRLLKESEETRNELERVKEKFSKLRDALHAERAKVEKAEQRANEAESLAGKGSFNPETTRVLHFQETPLVQSLKEEIQVLQRQLDVANNNNKSSAVAAAAHHDPAKLNKRLKENFKEQISLFREGVYLMTGFKVDMLPGTDRPTFRVRSMYAEQEEDHLMLKWPKGEHVSSLDILNTDLAKSLAKSSSYDYMTKFHSLPAFLASAQLSWFEKQTVM